MPTKNPPTSSDQQQQNQQQEQLAPVSSSATTTTTSSHLANSQQVPLDASSSTATNQQNTTPSSEPKSQSISKQKKHDKKKQQSSSSSPQKKKGSKKAQQEKIQFTSKQPPSAIQITLHATSPFTLTTPKQQFSLQPFQPLSVPFVQKFIIGTTKIQLSYHKKQEYDVDDGKVEILLIGKKENKSSRFAPIQAATVDDLKKQLEEKRKESKQEIARLEEELDSLIKNNEKLVRTRDDLNSNYESLQEAVREIQERVSVARKKESDKNEKTKILRDELKRMEDELRTETEKLEVIQKTKANADTVIENLTDEIDQNRTEYKRHEKLKKEQEGVLQKSKERLEQLKATIAESDKGTLQQVKDLEEKIKKVDAKHDKALKNIIQEVDQVKREAARFTKQASTAKEKLTKILDANRRKLVDVPREIVDEIFELRAAIQLKKFNEQFLTQEIQKLLQKPDLQEKVKAADTSTAEQFMLKKTKYEAEIIDELREKTMNQFKLPREAFFEADYKPIPESDGKKYESFSQQVLNENTLDHLDLNTLTEYIHMAKLMQINRQISDEIEKTAQKVAEENGDNFAKIKAQIEEEAFDDRSDTFVKLKPDEGLKVYQLEDFLEEKPKMQEKGMDQLRLNVKLNVLASWKRRIEKPEDLLAEELYSSSNKGADVERSLNRDAEKHFSSPQKTMETAQ